MNHDHIYNPHKTIEVDEVRIDICVGLFFVTFTEIQWKVFVCALSSQIKSL